LLKAFYHVLTVRMKEYHPSDEAVVKALCLHVAHDCNLRCRYCFGKTGNFGMTRELMPLSVAEAAIDFLLDNSGPRRNLNVDFFGGEPLLNFDVVKAAIEYCDKKAAALGKHVDFTVTTNCVLLDEEIISFLNEREYACGAEPRRSKRSQRQNASNAWGNRQLRSCDPRVDKAHPNQGFGFVLR